MQAKAAPAQCRKIAHVEAVFQHDRDAMQRRLGPVELRLARSRSRFGGKVHDKRVHCWIVLLNLLEMRVYQFHRRHLPLTDHLRHRGERQSVRHQIEYRRARPIEWVWNGCAAMGGSSRKHSSRTCGESILTGGADTASSHQWAYPGDGCVQ